VPEPVARANGHAQTRRSRSGGAARSIQPPGDGKAGPSGAARLPSDYYALAGPELYYLLTAELAWTADAHRKWLTELLTTELLAPRHRSDGL
jgi:hypothetical protein